MEDVGVVDAAERCVSGTWLDHGVKEMFWFRQIISSQRETENIRIWGIVRFRHMHDS